MVERMSAEGPAGEDRAGSTHSHTTAQTVVAVIPITLTTNSFAFKHSKLHGTTFAWHF